VRVNAQVLAAGRARGQADGTAACPRAAACRRLAPRQGFAGAGLRPPWTRVAAQRAKLINESQGTVSAYVVALINSKELHATV